MKLSEIQVEQKVWRERNFPTSTELWMPVMGVAEESGELCHAVLKKYQGIRGSDLEHDLAMWDAIGDISIYLMDMCNMLNIDFESVIQETWKVVRERDWQKYPKNGKTE